MKLEDALHIKLTIVDPLAIHPAKMNYFHLLCAVCTRISVSSNSRLRNNNQRGRPMSVNCYSFMPTLL